MSVPCYHQCRQYECSLFGRIHFLGIDVASGTSNISLLCEMLLDYVSEGVHYRRFSLAKIFLHFLLSLSVHFGYRLGENPLKAEYHLLFDFGLLVDSGPSRTLIPRVYAKCSKTAKNLFYGDATNCDLWW